MSLGDQVEAYVAALLPLGSGLVFERVDALIARDSVSRWWETNN